MIRKILCASLNDVERAAADVASGMGISCERMDSDNPTPAMPPGTPFSNSGPFVDNQREIIRKKVLESDGTLIITRSAPSERCVQTMDMAEQYGKPIFWADLTKTAAFEAAMRIEEWVRKNTIHIIYISGPSDAGDPQLYRATLDILETVFLFDLMNGFDTGASMNPQRILANSEPADSEYFPGIPSSAEEAADILLSRLSFRERTRIANASDEKTRMLAANFIPFMEREFRLGQNDPLIDSCRKLSENEKEEPATVIFRILREKAKETNVLKPV